MNPLSYPRLMEYQLTLEQLGPLDGARVLDIGSPKLLALGLARHTTCELWATDIQETAIAPWAALLPGIADRGRVEVVRWETADARTLSYPDASFDAVYAISVVEHIPGDGDAAALREIARVLRPGGVASITVPFDAERYDEEFVEGRVFEREGTQRTFYQRRYDSAALERRLDATAGLRLEDATYFGEPLIPFERGWNRIPMTWKAPLLWAQPLFAKLFLKRMGTEPRRGARGVALKFRRLPADAPDEGLDDPETA